jgi:hypothetical protein
VFIDAEHALDKKHENTAAIDAAAASADVVEKMKELSMSMVWP